MRGQLAQQRWPEAPRTLHFYSAPLLVAEFASNLNHRCFCSSLQIIRNLKAILSQAGHAFPDDGETLSDDEPLSNLASQHAHKRWKQDKTKDANTNGGQDAMDTG